MVRCYRRPPSPVFGGWMTTGAGGGGGGAGAGVAGRGVGEALQLIVTVAWPLALPELALTTAEPPWPCGAVRTARTPPPWSTAVVGEIVPIVVVRLTVAPGVFVTAVT